jgi:hypothetical protein
LISKIYGFQRKKSIQVVLKRCVFSKCGKNALIKRFAELKIEIRAGGEQAPGPQRRFKKKISHLMATAFRQIIDLLGFAFKDTEVLNETRTVEIQVMFSRRRLHHLVIIRPVEVFQAFDLKNFRLGKAWGQKKTGADYFIHKLNLTNNLREAIASLQ